MGQPSLRIESLSKGRITYLRLYGTIDETFSPNAILDAIDGRDVIVNLKAVTRFSSFGVREWVHCFDGLVHHVDRLLFVECSPAFVGHLNIVENFAGPARVVSVQVPYYCENCKWDTDVTCELTGNTPPRLEASVACQRCGAEMVLDEDETYFSFLNGVKVAHLDEDLIMFLSDFSDARPPVTGERPAVAAGETGLPLKARVRALGRRTSGKARELGAAVEVQLRRLGTWVTRTWKSSSRWVQIGVAAGSASVLLAVAVVAIVVLSDDTEERLLEVAALIEKTELEQADRKLTALEQDGVEAELLAVYHGRIAEIRERRAAVRRAEQIEKVIAEFNAGRYQAVIAGASEIKDAYETDSRLCYALAESHRMVGQPEEANLYWHWYLEHWPDTMRSDDAMFWRAEFLADTGAQAEAMVLYERVLKTPDSNFKRSSRKRLRSLRNKMKKKR